MLHRAAVLRVILPALILTGCGVLKVPEPQIVEGHGFHHRVFAGPVTAGEVVHLYIEGDGRPFIDRHRVSPEPTPRHSRMLMMMLQDDGPAVFLGRPCYFGMAMHDGCDSHWWTTERYSPAIVASMIAAARRVLAGRPAVLIGYSGGAVLAVAMAAQMPEVEGVVTLAGNLDLDAWTTLHGYTPLTHPGDMAGMLKTISGIPQMHFFGGRDSNVPPKLIKTLAPMIRPNSVCVLPTFDHGCCWERRWPVLVKAQAAGNCETAEGSVYSPAMEDQRAAESRSVSLNRNSAVKENRK